METPGPRPDDRLERARDPARRPPVASGLPVPRCPGRPSLSPHPDGPATLFPPRRADQAHGTLRPGNAGQRPHRPGVRGVCGSGPARLRRRFLFRSRGLFPPGRPGRAQPGGARNLPAGQAHQGPAQALRQL